MTEKTNDENNAEKIDLVNEFAERFIDVVNPKLDLISIILRGHLFIEHYVDEVLSEKISKGYILKNRFKYLSQKLNILEAINIMPIGFIESFRELNNLRHKCVHELNFLEQYAISENDIDKIGQPLGEKYFDLKNQEIKKNKKTSELYKKGLLVKLLGILVTQLYARTSEATTYFLDPERKK